MRLLDAPPFLVLAAGVAVLSGCAPGRTAAPEGDAPGAAEVPYDAVTLNVGAPRVTVYALQNNVLPATPEGAAVAFNGVQVNGSRLGLWVTPASDVPAGMTPGPLFLIVDGRPIELHPPPIGSRLARAARELPGGGPVYLVHGLTNGDLVRAEEIVFRVGSQARGTRWVLSEPNLDNLRRFLLSPGRAAAEVGRF